MHTRYFKVYYIFRDRGFVAAQGLYCPQSTCSIRDAPTAYLAHQTRECELWMAGTIHHQLPPSFVSTKEVEEDDSKKCKTSTSSRKDLLWKEFFRDPSKWWDNRNSKPSPGCPDFKHRVTPEPLWLDSRDTPSWVFEELRTRGDLAALSGDPCPSKFQIDAVVAALRACT
ncbi:hypothetical protein L7F22_037017 [Adiantum nelumboides]|nr:hypothetical protein [Adiantum nelumboides]